MVSKMPKAGKYDYPFFDLDACIDKLRELHSITKTDENKRELVAETLKMSIKGVVLRILSLPWRNMA